MPYKFLGENGRYQLVVVAREGWGERPLLVGFCGVGWLGGTVRKSSIQNHLSSIQHRRNICLVEIISLE
ncbi:MAG: hypothetical protein M5U34_26385 [Chloroflexi bacterium]|nr:hypothetical protein [Chloroflexota bacterium]